MFSKDELCISYGNEGGIRWYSVKLRIHYFHLYIRPFRRMDTTTQKHTRWKKIHLCLQLRIIIHKHEHKYTDTVIDMNTNILRNGTSEHTNTPTAVYPPISHASKKKDFVVRRPREVNRTKRVATYEVDSKMLCIHISATLRPFQAFLNSLSPLIYICSIDMRGKTWGSFI